MLCNSVVKKVTYAVNVIAIPVKLQCTRLFMTCDRSQNKSMISLLLIFNYFSLLNSELNNTSYLQKMSIMNLDHMQSTLHKMIPNNICLYV